ncbi:hypothetical protein BBC27_08780 [Acidithiobacillus ferrivorans]|uniref:Type IV secretion system coupling protein TraD DNA-binding domain-containing protein n=1 Tax=Acidithiobacillus ferrivorans TaxID=160808 RepID=A0A1B9BZZ8_9PROT|nr:type IV secretion system DNA-binding domain-containing protein [Acidithiobacillus ferrivorans]OCB03278.1 hypothetical protein BBC27_08780 [Acidithiobacillus ferrivorans]
MFDKLMKKVKEVATPERIAALRERAGDLAVQAGEKWDQAHERIDAHKQRREEHRRAEEKQDRAVTPQRFEDLPKEVQKTLQTHADRAASQKDDTYHRGSALIDLTSGHMRQALRNKTRAGDLCIAGVPLDAGDEQQHILLCGAPGTGKSVEIKKALRTIRQRGQRAVVYDPSGEFTSMFYRPGQDIILNPLDQRGAAWNPWQDAESFEYAALAKSFIHDRGQEADPFWTESARATFEALLMQSQSLDELVYLGISAPLSELAGIVADAGFSGMIGPEKTFQSTRATLSVYLRSLGMLENVQRGDESAFSFRKWAETDVDQWVFLPVPARARDAIRPLVSMFLDTAVRHVMGLRPDPERRIWLELDELPSLQNIPSLSPALAEGRKFGISAVLGVQSFPQMKKSFGDAVAQALWGLPKTRLYLRISDAETAEMISKELGEAQLKRKTHSNSASNSFTSGQSSSNSESSSNSTSEAMVIERIVLPAEIAGLPDLVGYLRTGGSHRVAKVKVEFDGIPRQGEQEDFVWKRQRALPGKESLRSNAQQEGKGMNEQVIEQVAQDKDIADIEAQEQKVRELAIEMMNESMAAWDDTSAASLTDSEMDELTGIFIQRARIELKSKASSSSE